MSRPGESVVTGLLGRAAVVAIGTFVSRLLGLCREIAIAALFTIDETDAFFVAFTIPNVLRQLLGEGAVSSAVVPVLSAKIVEGGDEAGREYFRKVRGLSLVALVTVTILGVAFAPYICELFASGYHARPGEFERTVRTTRLLFPYILLIGTAALGMAALHTKKRFGVASFAPGLLNVAILAAAFTLPPLFTHWGVDRTYALALGALVGGLLQVLAQWPALRQIGFFERPSFRWNDPAVRQTLRRIGPIVIGVGIYYVDVLLSRRLLSDCEPGSQSYFSWAFHICDFPQGIFIMALSTAALPSMAGLAALGKHVELAETFTYSLRYALFIAIPSSVALAVLAEPLVTLLFQRGHFGLASAHETARALAWQGSAIWTVAVVRQCVALFHSMGDTRTPVVVSACDLGVFIVIALVLRPHLGHVAVSIALAGSSLAQMLLLAFTLSRRLPVRLAPFAESVGKTVIASALSGYAGINAVKVCATTLPPHTVGFLSAVVFAMTFFLASWGLRTPELDRALVSVGRLRALWVRAS